METESSKVVPPVTVPPSTVGSLRAGHFSQRRALSIVSLALGALLLLVVGFLIGFSTGLQKARFSYAWGENYERNFMGPIGEPSGQDKFLKRMDGRMLRSGHGAAGEIISLNADTVAVTGLDGEEWSFSVSAKTKIKKGGESVEVSQLEVGDRIVVLGRPNAEGTLVADFIRAISKDNAKRIDDVLEKAGLPLPNPARD